MRTESGSLDNVGFLLAKASQRFNERLVERFAEQGFAEVRPAYGSVLMPLFEQDDLRIGEIGARSRLSKQSMTRLVAQCEDDGRATRVALTARGRRLRTVARQVLRELDDEIVAVLSGRQLDALKRALRG